MSTLQTVLVALERRIPGSADREDMIDAINIALSEIGHITQVDTSSTVANDTTEYALPTGVYNVVRVEVANSSSADYDYTKVFNWHEVNGYLYFTDELGFSSGNTIRIYYNAPHDDVTDDTDTISNDIPIPLLVAEARYQYEHIQFMDQANLGVKDETILQRLDNDRLIARQRFGVNRINRDPILG